MSISFALSPMSASELFMANFEKRIERKPWFPRIWLRYVDDVYAIIKKDQIDCTIQNLNAENNAIK